jgi:cytochrome bd-type quinol oxidase subunit 1
MLLAAFLTTGMCVVAAGAWYMLRGVHRAEARAMLHWGLENRVTVDRSGKLTLSYPRRRY